MTLGAVALAAVGLQVGTPFGFPHSFRGAWVLAMPDAAPIECGNLVTNGPTGITVVALSSPEGCLSEEHYLWVEAPEMPNHWYVYDRDLTEIAEAVRDVERLRAVVDGLRPDGVVELDRDVLDDWLSEVGVHELAPQSRHLAILRAQVEVKITGADGTIRSSQPTTFLGSAREAAQPIWQNPSVRTQKSTRPTVYGSSLVSPMSMYERRTTVLSNGFQVDPRLEIEAMWNYRRYVDWLRETNDEREAQLLAQIPLASMFEGLPQSRTYLDIDDIPDALEGIRSGFVRDGGSSYVGGVRTNGPAERAEWLKAAKTFRTVLRLVLVVPMRQADDGTTTSRSIPIYTEG